MKQVTKKKTPLMRVARIVIKTILYLILFFLVVILLILTPPVQNYLRKKAVAYLEKKLDTKVEVGRIFIGLPKKVVVEDVYIEDRQKDTLLSAGTVKVDIALFRLIFKGEVNINKIELANSTVKVKRQLPDTAFNFQFVIDAFTTPATTKKPADTTAAPLVIRQVKLDKIRLIYKDVVTGNDIETWLDHFDTKIDRLDTEKQHFDIPSIAVNGLTARVYQSKPLATPEPVAKDIQEAITPPSIRLDLKNVNLQQIRLDYRNDASALYARIELEKTQVKVNNLDLAGQFIDLEHVSLDNTKAGLVLGKKETARAVVKETKQEIETRRKAGWRIRASTISLNNNAFTYDDNNQQAQSRGMDYAHLGASSLTLHVNDFTLSDDSIGGHISRAAFKEKSGFELQKLETRFLYAATETYLQDLYLKTPGTELQRHAAIRYASLDALQNDIANMEIDADIEYSRILVNDILVFAPMLRSQPAFADPSATWRINAKIKGRIKDLRLDALQVQGLNDTKVDIRGRLSGLPDMKNTEADLAIREITSSKRDILSFMPASALPKNITIPQWLSIKGKARGDMNGMTTDVSLKTDLGQATVNGTFMQFADINKIRYDAAVQTTSLDLGTLLQQKETFGPVSASFTIKGSGATAQTANATFDAKVHSAVVRQYTYRDLVLNGTVANQRMKANAAIVDPNLHFTLAAEADLSKKYPAVVIDAMIDSMKMQPLHLTSNTIIFRGKIEGDFPVTNPDALEGKLLITQSLLVTENNRLQQDTITFTSGRSDSGHYASLRSDIMNARLSGQYKLTTIAGVFLQTIQPYFAIDGMSATAAGPYDFRLNAYIIDHPALKTMFPGFETLDSVQLESHFSDRNGTNVLLQAAAVDMGPTHLRGLRLEANTDSSALNVKASLKQFTSGNSIKLVNTTLTAILANNNMDFVFNIKDRELKDKYNLEGLVRQPQRDNYIITLNPRNLLLNYNTWNISDSNKLIVDGKNINATNFTLSRSGQQLRINSRSQNADAPMEAEFVNFRLATLTGFIQPDTTWANGNINGRLTLVDLNSNPVFTADLTINELRLKKDTIGDLHLLVNNRVANTYHADITLTGHGNDVRLSGDYHPFSASDNFDFVLDIRKMPFATAQAISGGALRDASGNVNGRFSVNGTLNRPAINGSLHFDKAAFTVSALNNYFSIDKEKIDITPEGIRFTDFAIKDSAGNRLLIDGVAATQNFSNYRFDMNIRANNFRALNSTKRDNRLFYGRLYFNTRMTVKGTEKQPVIDGRLTVNEQTQMTVVLPQRDPGIMDREGIVQFVDLDAPLNDSLFLAAYDSLNTSGFTGMDISMTIEVNKEASFTLVVDEGNGDFLNVKGEAMLAGNVDRSGKIILSGTYELESGSYELSFNFLRRKFDIQQGSKIIWEGEPTKATVDVIAKYVANVAPLDLVKNQLGEEVTTLQRNTYMQKLPFDVILKMEGELLQPKISFDIILPENKSYVVGNEIIATVRTRLEQLRQEEGEMNKQVFSLLLLNRFVSENPFAMSDYTSASTLARASVSKLLTEQLNRLAADLITGVELNFDIQSSQDYTTGQRADRTDLNVGLSKRLLNDRLTVTVGSNFELEGPQNSNQQSSNIAGNVALDYKISRDGRYLLRAYRKNEYQGVIDGYVIETGVGFIITLDYNRFRDIFQSRRRMREERRKRRQAERQNQTGTTTTEPAKQE